MEADNRIRGARKRPKLKESHNAAAEWSSYPNDTWRVQIHRPARLQLAKKQLMSSAFQVNTGPPPSGGSGRGCRGGGCSYLGNTLQRSSFRLLPAGMHKVFHQDTCQHSLAPPRCEKMLLEEKEKRKNQLQAGHQRVRCTAVINYESFRKIHNPVGLWQRHVITSHFHNARESD